MTAPAACSSGRSRIRQIPTTIS